MNNKEKYLEIVNSRFDGKVKEILTKQINLFYKNEEVDINRYLKGEKVYLEKGTFIHGIYGGLETIKSYFSVTWENKFDLKKLHFTLHIYLNLRSIFYCWYY